MVHRTPSDAARIVSPTGPDHHSDRRVHGHGRTEPGQSPTRGGARFEISTTIKRPIEDVFAVLSDFSNTSKWASVAVEPPKKTSAGPIGVGTTWLSVGRFLGRKIESDFTFTEFEANRKITAASKKPFPITFIYTLERVAGGTRVRQTGEAEVGGFFKLAEPLVVKMAKRQFQNDLNNLRDLMEAHAL